MESYQLADKILVYLLNRYKDSNNSSNSSFNDVVKNFADTEESKLIEAINKLKSDGFLELMYYNLKPGSIFIKPAIISQMSEDEFLGKGYNSYAEIMDILSPKKKKRKRR